MYFLWIFSSAIASVMCAPVGFGAFIEGAAVDPQGNIYAVHLRGTDTEDNSLHRNTIGTFARGADEASEFFVGESAAVFNGIRFDVLGDYAYLADVGQGKVIRVDVSTMVGSDYCMSAVMAAAGVPNDLAMSRSGLLFLSGQDWASSTGALWLCRTDGTATLLEGNMARTNGIALSPDDSVLYLTEAVGSPVVSDTGQQRIWKYQVAADGSVSNKTLFYDFSTDPVYPEARTDSDGMRCDTEGNLYITRNGLGKITVISPEATLVTEHSLNTITYPTNLEFGGADGRTLFVVGRCGAVDWGQGDGCVEEVVVSIAGRSYALFQAAANEDVTDNPAPSLTASFASLALVLHTITGALCY